MISQPLEDQTRTLHTNWPTLHTTARVCSGPSRHLGGAVFFLILHFVQKCLVICLIWVSLRVPSSSIKPLQDTPTLSGSSLKFLKLHLYLIFFYDWTLSWSVIQPTKVCVPLTLRLCMVLQIELRKHPPWVGQHSGAVADVWAKCCGRLIQPAGGSIMTYIHCIILNPTEQSVSFTIMAPASSIIPKTPTHTCGMNKWKEETRWEMWPIPIFSVMLIRYP